MFARMWAWSTRVKGRTMLGERNDGEHDDSTLVPHLEAGLNRRRVLGGAVSGFALATSGLLLPEWEDPASAARPMSARGIAASEERE